MFPTAAKSSVAVMKSQSLSLISVTAFRIRGTKNLFMETDQLLYAYARGYFPMPDPETGEILWLAPHRRAFFPLDRFHVSRSLRASLRKIPWEIQINKNFLKVMDGCRDRDDTWITREFVEAYGALHQKGYAHSVEVYFEGKLVGGTYGVSLGGAFFAESMFHTKTDASKVALYHLVERMKARGMELLEVQFLTPHLQSLGAIEIPKIQYLLLLRQALQSPASFAEAEEPSL